MDDKRRDWILLRQFVDKNSQEAFRELTTRYIGLVFGTTLRELGDRAMAEDVTQAVFLILARKAHSFRPNIILAAWLFDTCKFTAKNAQSIERRRLLREQKMAMEIQQLRDSLVQQGDSFGEGALNDALSNLSKPDRQAVLLRFVCGYSLQETGEAFGISENTARMRINRALEKLRRTLTKAGIGLSAIAVADLLETRAAEAASAGLEAKIAELVFNHSTTTLAGVTAHTIAQGVLKSMTLTNIKIITAATCGLILAGGMVYQGAAKTTRHGGGAKTPASRGFGNSQQKVLPGDLLDQMATAHKTVPSYSAHVAVSEIKKADDLNTIPAPKVEADIAFVRPDKAAMHGIFQPHTLFTLPGVIHTGAVTNGSYFYRLKTGTSDYEQQGLYWPGKRVESALSAADLTILFFYNLTVSKTPYQIFYEDPRTHAKYAPTFTLGRDDILNGVPVDTVIGELQQQPGGTTTTVTFAIGKRDHLLRRMTMMAYTNGRFIAGQIEDYTNVKSGVALPDSLFAAPVK